MKKEILKINTPTINKRVYSKECMEGIVRKSNEGTLLVYPFIPYDSYFVPSLKDMAGVVNSVALEGNSVIADIVISGTSQGEFLQDLIAKGIPLRFATDGSGKTTEQEDGTVKVEDYKLSHVVFTLAIPKIKGDDE